MDSSFSSTSTSSNNSLHQDVLRVNRFLSRNHARKQLPSTTSPTHGTSQMHDTSSKHDTLQSSNKNQPTPSSVPILNVLSACTSINTTLHYIHPESQTQNVSKSTYVVIEGRHGPITSERRDSNRRSKQTKVKRYVAARRRAKLMEAKVPSEANNHSFHTSDSKEIQSSELRVNESPTTVSVDISSINTSTLSSLNQPNLNDSFVLPNHNTNSTTHSTTPLKSNFNKTIGMIPKKKLSWWDDESNKNKPCTLRSDVSWDDAASYKEEEHPFGNSGCPHDNFKDLWIDYTNRFRTTVVDLFHAKIGNGTTTNRSATILLRDNFASFSEEECYEEYSDGCVGPTRRLVGVVKMSMPPVCEFETSS